MSVELYDKLQSLASGGKLTTTAIDLIEKSFIAEQRPRGLLKEIFIKNSFAFISWNSEAVIVDALQKLYDLHIIDFYAFIYHFAESCENKNHYHIYVKLSVSVISWEYIKNFFYEEDENGVILPFCDSFKSDFKHWFFYSLHDKAYLSTKNLFREYSYAISDFKVSNEDYFLELVSQSRADLGLQVTKLSLFFEELDFLENYEDLRNFALKHSLSISEFNTLMRIFSTLKTVKNNNNDFLAVDFETIIASSEFLEKIKEKHYFLFEFLSLENVTVDSFCLALDKYLQYLSKRDFDGQKFQIRKLKTDLKSKEAKIKILESKLNFLQKD